MTPPRTILVRCYAAVTGVLVIAGAALAYLGQPPAQAGAPGAMILFLHLPAAINMFMGAFVIFVAGIGFLGSRRRLWDDLARAATQVTLLCCTVVLLSGMVWARAAWGSWWAWSPRLTFSLVLWFLYAASLLLRLLVSPGAPRAMVSAVYGIVAFVDVPLVYLSVKLLPDIHPASVELSADARRTLLVCLAAATSLCAGLLVARLAAIGKTPTIDHSEPPAAPTGGPLAAKGTP